MTEALRTQPPSIDEYQRFVAGSRFASDPGHDWQPERADQIDGEWLEVITQHGPASLLLSPNMPGITIRAEDELLYKVADELGDMVWYGVDTADRFGLSVATVANQALSRHSGQIIETAGDFASLEDQVAAHASDIRLLNKLGLYIESDDPEVIYTSLQQHPGYIFGRVVHRLSSLLKPGENRSYSPTATDLEILPEMEAALGDYMLTIAYIAKQRLGISLADITAFNMAKLQHRALYGKANDINFDATHVHSAM